MPVSKTLMQGILNWVDVYHLKNLPISLAGFSQGAAMTLALALNFPHQFHRAAVLSGFLPQGGKEKLRDLTPLSMEFFIAHGRLDDLVPVSLAQETTRVLKQAGAKVDYCEDDVGHKMSRNCIEKLRAFLTR